MNANVVSFFNTMNLVMGIIGQYQKRVHDFQSGEDPHFMPCPDNFTEPITTIQIKLFTFIPFTKIMSSLIFLGFSTIIFILSYGIMWLLVPMILGSFFSIVNDLPIKDPNWRAVYDENEELVRFLIPLSAAIGVFILVLRVLMVSSATGRD